MDRLATYTALSGMICKGFGIDMKGVFSKVELLDVRCYLCH